MEIGTEILFAGLAIIILLWGFERYRTRFERSDLFISGIAATGFFLFAFVPTVFDYVGGVFDIQHRVVAAAVAANTGLLILVMYLSSNLNNVRAQLNELTRELSVQQAPVTDGGKDFIQVVIPAYNEEVTIGSVIQSLPDTLLGYDVHPLVVSDGSADDTAKKAEINGTIVVEHPINQGQGGALQTGFQIAQQNGTSIVVTMDGDGQHPAEELERLVRPIVENQADFVMGSRYLGQDDSGNGVVRQAGIHTFTWIINMLTKSDITDCTNGFRAIRGSELDRLTLTEERFSAPELIIEARKSGLRVKEIPITIEERQAGETKKPQLGYALGLTQAILITWIR